LPFVQLTSFVVRAMDVPLGYNLIFFLIDWLIAATEWYIKVLRRTCFFCDTLCIYTERESGSC